MIKTAKSLISIKDISRDDILWVLNTALTYKNEPPGPLLKNKIIATLFFEPSTRTRLSFEAAALKLGAQIIGFSEHAASSSSKGESLSDTIRIVGDLCDLIVLRHPLEGSSQLASFVTETPIINAGDGANEHPTQTLTDLYSILETQGRLDKLNIALAGDLKYGRTVHSLMRGLKWFEPRLYLVCSEGLEPPKELLDELKETRVKFSFHDRLEDILPKLDILYMTRLQKERQANGPIIKIGLEGLRNVKNTFKIMHPLPRQEEIDPSIDKHPSALYFQQARNGLWVRQALLGEILL